MNDFFKRKVTSLHETKVPKGRPDVAPYGAPAECGGWDEHLVRNPEAIGFEEAVINVEGEV